MTEEAVLGGGCFWCVEAVFKEVDGVEKVASGYAGGKTKDPSYEEVCEGDTGHAEIVKIEFDPEEISFEDLLDLFFRIHNPTTKNRQGADIGEQYRSIILYTSEEQKKAAERKIQELQQDHEDEIVTRVRQLEKFYRAEEKHQDYFEKNPNDTYCRMHIPEKLEEV